MAVPRIHFARQDLSAVTGAPDVVLGYWIKQGLLQPEDAGGGRGRHLRFSRMEAALACILGRLRSLGFGNTALAKLASEFHQAVDWIESKPVDISNFEEVDDLVRSRAAFVRAGQIAGWTKHLEKVTKDDWFDLSPRTLRFLEDANAEEWIRRASLYRCLVELGLMRPSKETRPLILARDGEDSWVVLEGAVEGDHVSIDLKAAGKQLWSLDK